MIALDLQTFRQSAASGSVTGVIFVELQSGAFPEAGWSDFPVIILSWWAEELLKMDTSDRRKAIWQFMDGAQCLTITKVTSVDRDGALTFGKLEGDLIEATQRVIDHCDKHQLGSDDLQKLRDNVQRLKANQSVQRTGASRSTHIRLRPSVAAGSRR